MEAVRALHGGGGGGGGGYKVYVNPNCCVEAVRALRGGGGGGGGGGGTRFM